MAVSAPFRASSKVHSEPFLELSDSFWRDYLETPNSLHYGLSRACGTGQKGTISGASRYRETRDPTRVASFQTVSPRTSVNKGKKESRALKPGSLEGCGGLILGWG